MYHYINVCIAKCIDMQILHCGVKCAILLPKRSPVTAYDQRLPGASQCHSRKFLSTIPLFKYIYIGYRDKIAYMRLKKNYVMHICYRNTRVSVND